MIKRTIGIFIFLMVTGICNAQDTDTTKTGTFKIAKQDGEGEVHVVDFERQDYIGGGMLGNDSISGDETLSPQFIGSLQFYLNENLRYPIVEKESGISGTVYLSFVIEKDGKITNVEILRGMPVGEGFNEEALRVVRAMPNWIPAMKNGKAVSVSYILPIQFFRK